jgi:tape measure domain-containing protein
MPQAYEVLAELILQVSGNAELSNVKGTFERLKDDIAQNEALMRGLKNEISKTTDAAKKLILEKELQKAEQKAKALNNELKGQVGILGGLKQKYRELEAAKDAAMSVDEIKRINAEMKILEREISKASGTAKGFNLGNIGAGFVGAAAALGLDASIQGLVALKDRTIEATLKLQSFRNALIGVSTTAKDGEQNFDNLIEVSDKLGFEIEGIGDAYKNYIISATKTGFTNKEARQQFEDVAIAARVLNLSTAELNGALVAFSQISSKGKVSAEELNQITERLPGTFEIAANSMGLTTAELRKQLELGNIYADEFIPKFTATLRNNFVGGVDAAVNSLSATLARANNEIFLFFANAGEKLTPLISGIANLTTSAFKSLNALFSSNADLLKDQTAEYDKSLSALPLLVTQYDELSAAGNKNAEQQAELQSVINKIVDIVPESATEFDKYGSALDINKTKVTAFLQEQKNLLLFLNKETIEDRKQEIIDLNRELESITATIKAGKKGDDFQQLRARQKELAALIQGAEADLAQKTGEKTKAQIEAEKEQQAAIKGTVKELENKRNALQKERDTVKLSDFQKLATLNKQIADLDAQIEQYYQKRRGATVNTQAADKAKKEAEKRDKAILDGTEKLRDLLQKKNDDIAKLNNSAITDDIQRIKADAELQRKENTTQLDKTYSEITKKIKEAGGKVPKELTELQIQIRSAIDTEAALKTEKEINTFLEKQKAAVTKFSAEIAKLQSSAQLKPIKGLSFEGDLDLLQVEFNNAIADLRSKKQEAIKEAQALSEAANSALLGAITPEQRAIAESNLKAANESIAIINGSYRTFELSAQRQFFLDRLQLESDYFDKYLKKQQDAQKEASNVIQLNENAELALLEELFAAKLITQERYEKGKAAIITKYQKERLISELDAVRAEIKAINDELSGGSPITIERRTQLEAQLSDKNVQASGLSLQISQADTEAQRAALVAPYDDAISKINKLQEVQQSAANFIISLNDQIAESEIKKYDTLIRLQEQRVASAQELADKGNAEALQRERERLDSLIREREKASLRQQRINAVLQASAFALAAAEGVLAISKAAAEGGAAAPFTIALTSIALLTGAAGIISNIANLQTQASAIQGLKEGDPYISGKPDFNFRNGDKDVYLRRLAEGERVVPAEQNKEYYDVYEAISKYKPDPNLILEAISGKQKQIFVPNLNLDLAAKSSAAGRNVRNNDNEFKMLYSKLNELNENITILSTIAEKGRSDKSVIIRNATDIANAISDNNNKWAL